MSREQIITYENYLALPDSDKNETHLLEILDFLKELNTTEISSLDIAKLFCHVVSKFGEENIEKNAEKIWQAFINIKQSAQTINSESSPTTEEKILLFLRDLVNEEEIVSEKILSDFKVVCEGLEKIKYIFILKNKEEKHYFPIGSLLKKVMESYHYLNELDQNTINTFILAMEMFTLENDIQSKEELYELVEQYNLEGLKILFKHNQLNRNWKQNLKANGVLLLVDDEEHEIYIRNENKAYFNSLFDKCELREEKNSHGNVMAYFIKKNYNSSAEFLSLEDVFLNSEYDLELKLQIIDKIFNEKYYNILMDKSFMKIGNSIEIVNEFSNKDDFIIIENVHQKSNAGNVFRYGLRKYGLNKIWGNNIDYVMYNSLFKLLLIAPISLREINSQMSSVSSSFQDALILYWLQNVKEVKTNLFALCDSYFNEIQYIRTKKTISNTKIEDIYWLPYKFPIEFVVGQINKLCKIQESDFKIYEILAKKGSDESLEFFMNNSPIHIKNQNLKITNDNEGSYFAYKEDEDFCINEDANEYLRILYNIQQKNNGLKSILDYSFCSANDMKKLRDKMRLQNESLLPQEKGFICDFDSIANLRILHHFIYNSFDENKCDIFCNLMRNHCEINYRKVLDSYSFNEEGVLYVPKESRNKCGVLNDINETYIKDKSKRDLGLYAEELKERSGYYMINNHIIKKIVFIFDTLLSGKSTKDYLNLFIGKSVFSKKEIHKFFYDKKEITVNELITKNNPDIEMLFFYGTHEGKEIIRDFVKTETLFSCAKIHILNDIDVSSINDVEVIKKLYDFSNEKCTLQGGFYPIIREFNQPKKNIFPTELLNPNNPASLFVKKSEMR